MELGRLVRLVRARWWLFAIVAGVGLVAGVLFTSLRNSQIQPEYEATAGVAVLRDAEQSDRAYEAKVVEKVDLAIEVNEEAGMSPRESIAPDNQDQATINFVAVGPDEESAVARAEEMRSLFLETAREQTAEESDDTQLQLMEIDSELERIESGLNELTDLQAAQSQVDAETSSQIALLQIQLDAIEGELSGLYIERAIGPDTTLDEERTEGDVEADINKLESDARELRLEIAGLQPQPTETYSETTRRIEQLTAEYEARLTEYNTLKLSAATAGVQSLGNPTPENLTGTETSPAINGVLGLIVGAFGALGLVVAEDRYRHIVWVGSDLTTVPLLGEVAARGTAAVPGQPWYELGGPPARKRAVQAIRVTVEGGVSASSSTLAFIGVSTPSSDVHELAADFAMSMVTSGSRVLLLDADFDRPSDLVEFSGEGATLSDMMSYRMDDEEAYRSFIKRSVTEPAEVHPGLTAIQVGRGLADPADALAGRRLQILLEEVRTIFDIVVVAGGDVRDAATQAVMNRMDNIVIALRPGRASVTTVETVRSQLTAFGVGVLGAALVLPPGRSGTGVISVGPDTEPPSSRRRQEQPEDVLVEALLKEREKARKSEQKRAVERPALGLGGGGEGSHAAPVPVAATPVRTPGRLQLIPSITPTTSADVHEQVASLIESTVESVLRGYSGSSANQRVDPGIRDVTKYGFVPLVRVKGHRSLGTRVIDALQAQLDDGEQRQLTADLVEYFEIESGGRTNERLAGAINRWVIDHYFTRHLAATGREPTVWHIASPARTFQALVHSTKCSRERIDLLRSEILRRQMDTLNRTLKSAVKAKRSSQVQRIEEQIKDLRTFDIALGWLYEGTTPNARLWYPWKGPEAQPQGWDPHLDEGIRANVAPLQRLGILVQDVLTGEELLAFSPPT